MRIGDDNVPSVAAGREEMVVGPPPMSTVPVSVAENETAVPSGTMKPCPLFVIGMGPSTVMVGDWKVTSAVPMVLEPALKSRSNWKSFNVTCR
jgi:hypothetical protein